MPTPKELYTQQLNTIADNYGRMEDDTVRALFKELDTLRKQVNAQVSDIDSPSNARQRQAAIERMISDFEAKYSAQLNAASGAAFDDGAASVSEPLATIDIRGPAFIPSLAQVNAVQNVNAALIKGITEELRKTVNLNISQIVLQQKTPFQAMQDLTTAFGRGNVDRQGRFVASGVTAKAERDIRTELQRVFNLSEHSQQLKTAETTPDLLKRWIATADNRTRPGHLDAHNRYRQNPIPIKEKFMVYDIDKKGRRKGSALLMYPTDPSAPPQYVINCRCKMSTIHPLVGVIGSSLDGRIASQLKRASASQRALTLREKVRYVHTREMYNLYWRLGR